MSTRVFVKVLAECDLSGHVTPILITCQMAESLRSIGYYLWDLVLPKAVALASVMCVASITRLFRFIEILFLVLFGAMGNRVFLFRWRDSCFYFFMFTHRFCSSVINSSLFSGEIYVVPVI